MRSSKPGRLQRVGRVGLPSLLAVLLGVAASVLVACGQTNGLLSSDDNASLGDQLGQVSDAVSAQDCGAAGKAAAQLRIDATRLSPTVNGELRRDLRRGADTVGAKAVKACRKQSTTTETIPTNTITTVTPTATTPTVTTPTATATTPTTPTPTATATATTPTTPPPPTTPTDTRPLTVPPPSGGAGPGGSGTGTVP